MSAKEPKSFCIYESRTATLVSSSESEKKERVVESTQRLARFLKPCARNITQAPRFLPTTLSETISHDKNPKLKFKGWKNPQSKWGDWVESLAGKHAYTWNQTGICDALLSSLYEVRRNPSLILGLVQYWCPNTSTFIFPWGEATITLEDIMILGGFSVLGDPVTLPLSSHDTLSLETKLVQLRSRMWRKSKSKKPNHQSWLKLFTTEELEESYELEHVGFLSLWLSRFVFPSLSDSNVVGTHVFPIAIHLSKGTRIALAPAVLATLYHNLSLLKQQLEEVVSSSVKVNDSSSVTVLGPLFQLVQMWAFERFPILAPNCPNELKLGEPRAARWHKLNSDATSFSLVVSALESEENFQWRPYAVDLKNWCFVSHYKENEQLVNVDGGSDLAEELRSFGVCLCADELVGLHCVVEKYMPYRVAMQFGMDQHVPGEFTVMLPICKGNFSFYVPSRCYKPCVSLDYLNWWKESNKKILKPEREVDDSNLLCPIQTPIELDKTSMLDVLMIAKQYCEEEEERHALSGASSESSSKRKQSTIEEESKEVESNNSCVVGKYVVVEGGESSKRRALKNDSFGFNNENAIGTHDNPLDVEDYACTTLGTSYHPIDIDDNYM